MLTKKEIKTIRKTIKDFADSTQTDSKKEAYCLFVYYKDGTIQKYKYKRLKNILDCYNIQLDYNLRTDKIKEMYLIMTTKNSDVFEIVTFEDNKTTLL